MQMKKNGSLYISFFILIFSIIVFVGTLYNFLLSKVSNDSTLKEVVIERGSIDSIANTLYRQNMIRSKLVFNLYVRISGNTNLQAATYKLSENMGTKKIVDILSDGNGESKEFSITFKEGINMRRVASIISDSTNHSEDEVYSLLADDSYLDELIAKYWFIGEEVKNKDIYYSLEGYLYPNTYSISSRNAEISEIIEKMLDEMGKQLEDYRTEIESSSLSVHELLTLASIVELEGTNSDDRHNIARVFFNRMNNNMNLGSDVTTYYASKIDMGERDLYSKEVNDCNGYNTRCLSFKGLPVSPICNASIDAIVSVLEPSKNDYLYFVADKNMKVYFSKDVEEHNKVIKNLKSKGLWYEY